MSNVSPAAVLPADGATAFDLNRVAELLPEIAVAMGQTFAMLLVAIPLAVLVGTPLGIWLYSMSPVGLKPRPKLHKLVDGLVNTMRSFPFLILLIAIIPVTRFIVGTTIGTAAVIVPLTINAIPYFARFVEQNLTQLGGGVVEAARAMGATRGQIVRDVLLVEAKPGAHRIDHHHDRQLHQLLRHGRAWWAAAASATSPSATGTTATRPA